MQINAERLVDTFCRLTEIDSPSFREREMADFLTERLRKIGFTVTEDTPAHGTAGNLFAVLPGEPDIAPVLLCAHMDTVEPACGKKAHILPDGVIRSSGETVLGADDMAAVAEILEAAAAIREQNVPHRTIELLLSYAEEAYCVGASNFDFSVVQSKEAYVLDYDGVIGSAAIAAPAIFSFEISVAGVASHAGFYPERGVSAIQIAAEALSQIKSGRINPDTTLNFGRIAGGTATNIVPDRCTIQGELRSFNEKYAEAVLHDIFDLFERISIAHGGTAACSMNCLFHAYHTGKESAAVKNYSSACEKLGLKASFTETFGGSDNNRLAYNGISGIVVASAMHKCHTCNEYTTVEEMTLVTKIITELLQVQKSHR